MSDIIVSEDICALIALGATEQLGRELAEARAMLEQVDNVLLVSGIAAKGDYRQAIHDLITRSIREQNDPALSRVIAEVALDAAQAQLARAAEALRYLIDELECAENVRDPRLDLPAEQAHAVLADPSTAATAEWLREKLAAVWDEALGAAEIQNHDYRDILKTPNPYAAGAPGEAKS